MTTANDANGTTGELVARVEAALNDYARIKWAYDDHQKRIVDPKWTPNPLQLGMNNINEVIHDNAIEWLTQLIEERKALLARHDDELARMRKVVDAAVAWAHMPDDWTLGDVGQMLVEDLARKVQEYEANKDIKS